MKEIRTQIVFIICFLAAWQIVYQMQAFPELLFPSLKEIGSSFVTGFKDNSLLEYTLYSMSLIVKGMGIAVVLAFVFSGVAVVSKVFHSIYNLIVSICDLLPGVALLPVVIVIVGVRPEVIVFLVVHAVLWPLSRNLLDGFQAVPSIYVEAGRNMGLRGMRLLASVDLPASMSYIVSGIKVCWARAWRGLISAEMIFGLASCPGIGLYINQMRTNLYNAEMYATLIVIIIIGLIVQYGILSPIERNTVVKWGMSN